MAVTSYPHAGEHWGGFPQPHHSPNQAFSLAKEPLLPFPFPPPPPWPWWLWPRAEQCSWSKAPCSQPFAKWEIRGRVTYFLCSQGASVQPSKVVRTALPFQGSMSLWAALGTGEAGKEAPTGLDAPQALSRGILG